MITTKEAFIDAKEVSQILGVGMTKAYAVIKAYNAELDAKGYYTMRGKCPRKYFEQKIYGYTDYYTALKGKIFSHKIYLFTANLKQIE